MDDRARSWRWVAVFWAGTVIGVMSAVRFAGGGMILRYLAPAMPALNLLAARGVLRLGPKARVAAGVLAAATVASSLFSAAQPDFAEPFPLAIWWGLNQVGIDLESIAANLY